MNEGRPRAEIGHVVLTDRVGYSKLSLEEKVVLDRELLEAVHACPAVVAAKQAGELILTDSGDGVSMIFFNDPVPAAESALFLYDRVARAASVKLRMGIHSGPVMRRIDAAGVPNVTGPGIEKAQRTMNQSDGSSVVVSEYFAENLRAFGDWRSRLVDIGERTVKHGESLHLFSLTPVMDSEPGLKIALVYKRNSEPDETLLRFLEERMRAKGYHVFVDWHMSIGVAWAQEVERQIRRADAVVALVSPRSLGSEMLLYEIQTAVHEFEQTGSPRVLPVRIDCPEPLAGELGVLVNRFEYTAWNSPEDSERVAHELEDALTAPEKPVTSTPISALEPAGGAVPVDSRFYIVRETDHDFDHGMNSRDSIVLVKGGRQMGKTSLLARGLRNAVTAGSRVVLTDFQSFGSEVLQSDERLYRCLAYELAAQLKVAATPQPAWNEWLGANINFEHFLESEILGNLDGQLIWAMDEVDRLFALPFATDFFGMLRSWHNRRALLPDSNWSRLTMAIAYATEAHLFITDLNQSPFNVGTRLTLSDFSLGQIGELNQRYGQPLQGAEEEARFWRLTGGQPYLSRRGLDELLKKSVSYSELESRAADEEGPFGDHLRRILIGVSNDPKLLKDTQAVLGGTAPPSADGFYRLRSAGILIGDSPAAARLRCELYKTYLDRHNV